MDRNKAIVVALIIVVAVLILALAAIMPNYGKEKSNVTIETNDTITEGDPIYINLTDVNGTPIENETVNVTITNDNGTTEQKTAVTNDRGVAKVKMDVDKGNYTVDCTFKGNDNFTENATSETIEVIEEPAVSPQPAAVADPGAFYSAQEGRIIYTGEIHDAPDGHRYRHLGNNEWELVE